ncbi:hypothetical protein [Litoribrevibacter albus]|nr:hypothetical protein [Litoribrevibacter albus]
MTFTLLLSILILFSSTVLSTEAHSNEVLSDMGEAGVVRVCQIEQAKYGFRIDLANLILSKTASHYGESQLIRFRKEEAGVSQNRCIELLKMKRIDLLYLPPKDALISNFDFIPFDIHAGMLGYRVFLIRETDVERFKKVKTIEDLRSFTGGFGSQWGDFKVFGLNDLPVVGAANTKVLLTMLKHDRFDYFHRGLHEAWNELQAQSDQTKGLIVEKHLALRYPFQVFYWFHKDNDYLKERFEKGLLLVLQDGSYRQLFRKHFDDIVTRANLRNRTIIDIDYPMSDEVRKWLGDDALTPFWLEENY